MIRCSASREPDDPVKIGQSQAQDEGVYLFARSRTGTLPHLVRVGRPVGGAIVASARGVSARLRCAHPGRVDARSATLLDTNIISEIRKRDRAHPNVARWGARPTDEHRPIRVAFATDAFGRASFAPARARKRSVIRATGETGAPKKIQVGLRRTSGYITGNHTPTPSSSNGQQIPTKGDPLAPAARGGTRARAG